MQLTNIFTFASLLTLTTAHTWLEVLQKISTNGTYVGPAGYTRGYIGRDEPSFDGGPNVLWQLPPSDAVMPDGTVRLRINSTDNVCHPSKRTSNYTDPEWPMLQVSPGDYFAGKYLENGHVTLPWNQPKPKKGGTVFVYGTTQSTPQDMIADVLKWDFKGTGGNGKGKLLTAQNFDDGRCHQINNCVDSAIRQVLYPNKQPNAPGAAPQEQWCETDIPIPHDQPAGKLTLYWVWQWPTPAEKNCVYPFGKDEYYTDCMDVEVVAPPTGNTKATEFAWTDNVSALLDQGWQTNAVSTFASRTAITTSPSFTVEDWKDYNTKATVTENAAFSSSCVTVMSNLAYSGEHTLLPASCPSGKWATGALFASISSSVLAAKHATPTAGQGAQPTAPPTPPGNAPPTPANTQPAATSTAPVPSQPHVYASTQIVTVTMTTVVTAGPVAAPSPAPDGQGQGGNGIQFKTLSTVYGPTGPHGGPPSHGGAPSPPGQPMAPTVAPDGSIQNGSIGRRSSPNQHLAGHRRHARQFE